MAETEGQQEERRAIAAAIASKLVSDRGGSLPLVGIGVAYLSRGVPFTGRDVGPATSSEVVALITGGETMPDEEYEITITVRRRT